MTLVLSDGTNSFTITIEDLAQSEIGKSKQVAVPGGNPILIPLGFEGPEFVIQGLVKSAADYAIVSALGRGVVLSVSSSSYTEFTATQNFFLSKKRIQRKGGSVGIWVANLTLIRKWS